MTFNTSGIYGFNLPRRPLPYLKAMGGEATKFPELVEIAREKTPLEAFTQANKIIDEFRANSCKQLSMLRENYGNEEFEKFISGAPYPQDIYVNETEPGFHEVFPISVTVEEERFHKFSFYIRDVIFMFADGQEVLYYINGEDQNLKSLINAPLFYWYFQEDERAKKCREFLKIGTSSQEILKIHPNLTSGIYHMDYKKGARSFAFENLLFNDGTRRNLRIENASRTFLMMFGPFGEGWGESGPSHIKGGLLYKAIELVYGERYPLLIKNIEEEHAIANLIERFQRKFGVAISVEGARRIVKSSDKMYFDENDIGKIKIIEEEIEEEDYPDPDLD